VLWESENHFCRSGLLLETIKNGKPTVAAKQANNQRDGLPVAGTELIHAEESPTGKLTRATASNTSCTTSWRASGQRETTSA
jgi:hypothetical protein